MNVTKSRTGRWICAIVVCSLVVAPVSAVLGDEAKSFELNPAEQQLVGAALAQNNGADEEVVVDQKEVATVESGKPKFPLSVSLNYALYSDYIFRFVNYSEYPGEGQEKPNHQLTADFAVDLGDFGSVGYTAWFEWFAAQKELDPVHGGQNCQEIDHTIYWSYSIEQIMTDLSVGYTFYTYPNHKSANTSEWWFSLEHNDAWMWKWAFPDNEDGILNPSLFFAEDVDQLGGVWLEFALSHDFEVFENFTITPGWMIAADMCYYNDHHTRFAGDQWSLVMTYDLGKLMQLPEWAGSLGISGELYFNNAWGTFARDTANDEFWGGMSVNWSWGG